MLKTLLAPSELIFRAWKAFPVGSYELRLRYDVFPRPWYAYCMYQAARLAAALSIDRISIIEFGVAGGNGLLAVERLAGEIEQIFPVTIETYGFDTGRGLPSPLDYRDCPSIWREGFFEMDVAALESRLKRSRLVLGDVRDTVPKFLADDHARVGAILVDLDYYSSTASALRLLQGSYERLLPRVFCYMDDVFSSDFGILCDGVGQLLAIREYNASANDRQLAPIAGFTHSRLRSAPWNEKIYVHHAFHHPSYCTYIYPDKNRQLDL